MRNQKGLTLVEVLASIVLLGILLTMFSSIFPQMMNFNKHTGMNLDANMIAKEILSTYKDNTSEEYKEKIESFLKSPHSFGNPYEFTDNEYKNLTTLIRLYPNPIESGEISTLYKIQVEIKRDSIVLSRVHGYVK